jgi:type 1 glutamine amidotransferase
MRIRLRWILWLGAVLSSLWLQPGASADPPKRVLYMTHSSGFVHDSIPTSCDVMQQLAIRSGQFDVLCSEDLSLISADNLQNFDIVYFFTSGELELSDQQKADLLAFVSNGKGFGGVHSATDTLYTWPEYGDLIGAYFNGHPWAQEVAINIEDPDDPIVHALAPSFRIVDEIYQFRDFSRDRIHVLMSLDTTSVDLTAPEVMRDDGDFPLAWRREYGQGRVFYTALGHFSETWLDERFQTMLLNALIWLAGGTGN